MMIIDTNKEIEYLDDICLCIKDQINDIISVLKEISSEIRVYRYNVYNQYFSYAVETEKNSIVDLNNIFNDTVVNGLVGIYNTLLRGQQKNNIIDKIKKYDNYFYDCVVKFDAIDDLKKANTENPIIMDGSSEVFDVYKRLLSVIDITNKSFNQKLDYHNNIIDMINTFYDNSIKQIYNISEQIDYNFKQIGINESFISKPSRQDKDEIYSIFDNQNDDENEFVPKIKKVKDTEKESENNKFITENVIYVFGKYMLPFIFALQNFFSSYSLINFEKSVRKGLGLYNKLLPKKGSKDTDEEKSKARLFISEIDKTVSFAKNIFVDVFRDNFNVQSTPEMKVIGLLSACILHNTKYRKEYSDIAKRAFSIGSGVVTGRYINVAFETIGVIKDVVKINEDVAKNIRDKYNIKEYDYNSIKELHSICKTNVFEKLSLRVDLLRRNYDSYLSSYNNKNLDRNKSTGVPPPKGKYAILGIIDWAYKMYEIQQEGVVDKMMGGKIII